MRLVQMSLVLVLVLVSGILLIPEHCQKLLVSEVLALL